MPIIKRKELHKILYLVSPIVFVLLNTIPIVNCPCSMSLTLFVIDCKEQTLGSIDS